MTARSDGAQGVVGGGAGLAEAGLTEVALAAAGGDAGAVSLLVARTSALVWRTCAGLVDPGSADDLAQDTYLRAVRSLRSYRGESNPVRWLVTIARRVCADEIARRQRDRVLLCRLRAERKPASTDMTGLCGLTDAIARLSPDRRDAFVLTSVAGLSYAEAALVCRCPIGTIRSRVARARGDLIGWLDDAQVIEIASATPPLAEVAS